MRFERNVKGRPVTMQDYTPRYLDKSYKHTAQRRRRRIILGTALATVLLILVAVVAF